MDDLFFMTSPNEKPRIKHDSIPPDPWGRASDRPAENGGPEDEFSEIPTVPDGKVPDKDWRWDKPDHMTWPEWQSWVEDFDRGLI